MNRLAESDRITARLPLTPFVICCVISFCLPVAACVGFRPTTWALILLRAPDFAILLLWLASALGVGTAILKLTRCHHRLSGLLGVVTAVGVGLGVISLLVLAAGLCVRPGALVSWAILLIGWIAGAWAREVWLISLHRESDREPFRWLVLLCAASLGLACIAALVPPGVLWGDEPNGYDVLEYHLQVPREWYELGRIVPLHHNVFSYFPFNVEMHYLLAMGLRGGPWAGMYLAQLMHVAFAALTVIAIYALVAERSKPMAFVAAAAVGTVPWMGLLAPVAYDEGGLLLWGTLAIGLSTRAPDDWRSMALAGAMAGLACGSKLTAVPIILLATPAVHVMLARFTGKAWLSAASYVLVGMLVFSPWLIKNMAWVGNPFFPEATSIFGAGKWSPTQVERWTRANHLPRPDQQNLHGRAAAAWDQVLFDWRYGYVLLPLALVAAGISFRSRSSASLFLILISLSIFWIFFTHLQSRFFTLAIPLSALLIGQTGAKRGMPVAFGTIVLLAGLGGLGGVYAKLNSINPHLFDFVGVESLSPLTPLADTQIAADGNVLLVGDGRPFLYDLPTTHLFYRTVFDVDAQQGETSDDAWRSSWPINGSTVQVIDAPELRRFARTYWGVPRPSDEVMQMPDAMVR